MRPNASRVGRPRGMPVTTSSTSAAMPGMRGSIPVRWRRDDIAAHMPGHNLIHPEDISPASEGCKCGEQFTGGNLDRPDIKAGKVRGDG